jgi:hypothetical protein
VLSRCLTLSAALLTAVSFGAVPCDAQEQNRFAFGINYTHRLASEDLAHGNGGLGVKWRLGHSESGWGRHIGLGWYGTDLERMLDGKQVAFGEVKVRPFVAGYGYTHAMTPKLHITGAVVGGLAFSTFEAHTDGTAALQALHPGAFDADVSRFIPVIRPEVSVWYDVRERIGLSVGAGYTVARPKLTVTSGAFRESERLRADSFALSAGLVYRVF